ncbi:hypothetical protein PCO31010_04792 [Pandoraea commovens]|uniref:Uncharacterized protein n=1 Tax=Pandoraea commovens TaxID=2508289 RepID=A0A5E4YWM6_9BURK|nr:hypothetical protein PCO31010_04792 [Pandoraea commovens]
MLKGFPLVFCAIRRSFGVFSPKLVPKSAEFGDSPGNDLSSRLRNFEIAGRRTQGARSSQAGHAKLYGSLTKRVRQPV